MRRTHALTVHSRLQGSFLLRMTDGGYDVIEPRGSGVENVTVKRIFLQFRAVQGPVDRSMVNANPG